MPEIVSWVPVWMPGIHSRLRRWLIGISGDPEKRFQSWAPIFGNHDLIASWPKDSTLNF
jgi:hypothetical protein